MIKITYPGTNNFTEFTFDPIDRNVKIMETESGSVTSTKQFVWCNLDRCEQRDNSSAVTSKFFSNGQTVVGSNRFFTEDHLASVRDVSNDSGSIVSQIYFTPFGQSQLIRGALDTDFSYTGFYLHNRSSLNLAVYRNYNPNLGRWINYDPIEEDGGINLFSYVANDSINLRDPSGLQGTYMPPGWQNCAGFFCGSPRGILPGNNSVYSIVRKRGWKCWPVSSAKKCCCKGNQPKGLAWTRQPNPPPKPRDPFFDPWYQGPIDQQNPQNTNEFHFAKLKGNTWTHYPGLGSTSPGSIYFKLPSPTTPEQAGKGFTKIYCCCYTGK